jgi:hypothetical protein
MFMSSLESGDRAKSVKITRITRHGNRRTRASGTERVESLVSRTRRLKKLSRGAYFAVRREASSVWSGGSSFAFGCLLVTSWERAIARASPLEVANMCCPRQLFKCLPQGEDVVCAGCGAMEGCRVVAGAEGQRAKVRDEKERPKVTLNCETSSRASLLVASG